MRLSGPAARLTILVDGNDQWHHRPLYAEIVHRAHREGLAGATALRGVGGFAALSTIHTSRPSSLGEHLPVVIVIIDDHRRVQEFLDSLEDLLPKGVLAIDDVQIIGYRRDPRHRRVPPPV